MQYFFVQKTLEDLSKLMIEAKKNLFEIGTNWTVLIFISLVTQIIYFFSEVGR